MPPEIRTFVDLLHHRATTAPEHRTYTFLPDGERSAQSWSNATLWARAGGVARRLADQGVLPGAAVAVIVDEGLGFHAALYGCMLARVLAVPLQAPDPTRPDRTIPRIAQICEQASASTVITHPNHARTLQSAWRGPAPKVLDIDAIEADPTWSPPPLEPDDIAYLQYTSGSTALPRGVRVSHHNLLHQLAGFDEGYGHDPDSVIVSWLPATHDLGLVYGRMMPLFVGCRSVFMAPPAFVQRPLRWLSAMSRFGATHTPTPNFGLELAVSRTTPEERATVDLSSVRVIVNGAEPIRRATEERFVEAFAPSGLDARALTHAYGMSEATAKITSEPVDRAPPRFLRVAADAYERGVVHVVEGDRRAIEVASTGTTNLDTRVIVVDPSTREVLGDDRIGEVWVSGDTVAQGYHDEPEATEETFGARTLDGQGPFLRTGDLGFLHEGELFLSGRRKDLVILRGENHHPQDLEWATQQAHPAIRPGGTVAFAVPTANGEGLAMLVEVTPGAAPPDDVCQALRRTLSAHGVVAESLVLVPPRTVPKTSSGKLQRGLARERFLSGTLPAIARRDRAPEATPARSEPLGPLLDGAPPRRRRRLLAGHLARVVGPMAGLAPDDVPHDMPLRDLGLDSVTAVELVEHIARDLGLEVPVTTLFDHPTIDALTRHLLEIRDQSAS